MTAEPTPQVCCDVDLDQAVFLTLAETLSSLIALIQDEKLVYVNPAACALLGRPKESVLGRSFLEVVHPDDRAAALARWRARQAGIPQPKRLVERLLHADGRAVWMDYSIDVIRFAGQPATLVTGYDITERRQAETALRDSEQRFRNLVTQAPVMLMSFDPAGNVRDVSNFWLQTLGYERHEVVGKDGWDFITPESRQRLEKAIEDNLASNKTVIRNMPIQAVRKDGGTVDLLGTSVAEVDDQGEIKGAICVQVNLTDLQRAEAALRESEERYRALVEHAPDAIMVLDADREVFVDANAHAETLFGYTRQQLLGMGPLDFCPEHQAGGRASCDVADDETRKVLAGETATFEFTHRHATGREIQCQVRLSRLPAAGRNLIRVTVTDITELKQLQEKVRHTEKLAAVGALAAGVAHEIGNPLMALSMAAQSLERRASDPYAQSKLVLIREHVERISRIVRQMNDLAQPPSGQRALCDVNHIVRRAVDMVRYDQRARGAAIDYDLAEHLPEVEAVEDELAQVCINLALNAFDAMAANPEARPRRLTVRSMAQGELVRVWFRDTGPGVPHELRAKIFEPFFSTKTAGRGSGLGLSISHRILAEHQGTLLLDEDEASNGAGGACFVFELPCRRRE